MDENVAHLKYHASKLVNFLHLGAVNNTFHVAIVNSFFGDTSLYKLQPCLTANSFKENHKTIIHRNAQ